MLVTYIQRNTILFLFSILLLGAGLGVNFLWLPYDLSIELWLLNLSPGLTLLVTWFLAARYRRKKWFLVIPGILVTFLVVAFVALINLANLFFLDTTQPITDLDRYSEVRSTYNDAVFVSHFPETIPSQATIAKFYYFPSFLQGGMQLQLRLKLPQQQWMSLQSQYNAVAKYRFTGGDTQAYSEQENYIPTPSFHTSDRESLAFPNTYEILVLDAQSQSTPKWNHGYSYGVALSAELSEIVYWAEDW